MTTKDVLISIGIPAYNAEKTIKRAIVSILNQKTKNIEIVISDNCSVDATYAICLALSQKYHNIKLFRNDSNKGAFENFKRVLSRSTGKYFMFLGSDDYIIGSQSVQALCECLDYKNSAVAATTHIIFDKDLLAHANIAATVSITGSKKNRIFSYLRSLPNDNSRFYSLYRKSNLDAAFNRIKNCHGYDWLLVLKMLTMGEYLFTGTAMLCRETTDNISYAKSVVRDNKCWTTFGFPMLPFSLQVISMLLLGLEMRAVVELIRINRFKRAQHIELLRVNLS